MLRSIVIEDEPAARRDLVLLTPWEELGIVCVGEAEDGNGGVDLFRRLEPEIIITDIRMPGMDGLAFIESIRAYAKEEDRASPEILVLSGYSEFEYAQTAMRLGVDEYLLKPVEEDVLRGALSRAIANIEKQSLRYNTEKHFFSEYSYSDHNEQQISYVDMAVELIKHRFIQGITIEEASSEMKISAGYLSRLFKQETGYTFVDYLMHIRVKRAIELLRNQTVKVYEVADLVGYSDARYFTQVFKKVTGTTPREFKENGNRAR